MAITYDIPNIAKDDKRDKQSTSGNAGIRGYVKNPGVLIAGICVMMLVAAGTGTLIYFLKTDDALPAASHGGIITEQLPTDQATSSTSSPLCPLRWWGLKDSCYFFGYDAVDYNSSQEYCLDMESVVVHINSAEENKYLTDFISALFPEFHYWIGIYHDRWSDDNSTVTEAFWGPGEPSRDTELCVAFWVSHNFLWADVRCERICRPICERKSTLIGL